MATDDSVVEARSHEQCAAAARGEGRKLGGRLLNQVMASAVKRQLVAANHCAENDLPRAIKAEMLFLTAEQVEQLSAELGEHYGIIVRFVTYTGLRAGEVVALQVKDIADRLRHSSISVTIDTYGHRFEAHDAALTEAPWT